MWSELTVNGEEAQDTCNKGTGFHHSFTNEKAFKITMAAD